MEDFPRNYQIQRRSYDGWHTVARVNSLADAHEWAYEARDAINPIEGEYRVMYFRELRFRFTV
jgi:hypothetical protein